MAGMEDKIVYGYQQIKTLKYNDMLFYNLSRFLFIGIKIIVFFLYTYTT